MAGNRETTSTEKLLGLIRSGRKNSGSKRSLSASGRESVAGSGVSPGKKLLPLANRDVVGVELSGKSLKMVRMSRFANQRNLEDAAELDLGRECDPDDPSFVSALKQALDDFTGGSSKVRIWSMVSPSKAEVWSVKVPMVKKGLANAVYWTARKDKSFEDREYIFDYRITGLITEDDTRKYVASVYIVPREDKNFYQKVFSRAGYKLHGLSVSTFAFQNFLTTGVIPAEGQSLAVLYIDQESTRIDVFHEKGLRLSRVIKTGLDSMLEAIMVETSSAEPGSEPLMTEAMDGLQAEGEPGPEDLRRACNLLDSMYQEEPPEKCRDVFEMIVPVLKRLALQVERTLDHYVNVLGNSPVDKVYLSGKPSAVSGLRSFMEEQLSVEVERLDPLHPSLSLNTSRMSLDMIRRIDLAPAAGLALSDNAFTPNLLFTARDHERERTSRLISKITAVACMLVAMTAGGYSWMEKQEIEVLRQEQAALKEQLNQFDPVLSRNDVQEMAADLEDQNSVLREVVRKNVPLGILQELSRLTPENIRLLNLIYNPAQEPDQPLAGSVVVDGIIMSEKEMFETYLSGYIQAIRSSILFPDSSVGKSYTETIYGQGEVFRFIINISLPDSA
ncbi:MAG: pilus assembly protein PilM [Desulfonatronovibrio sp.]